MNTRLTFLVILFSAYYLIAQDRHFWDQAVGGRSALLGGIAVGGVNDYSATFYNPGAISFLSKKSMNFTFNMYGVKDFSFINGGGPGIDSRYTRVSLFPASLAGPLPFLGDSLNRFSYMIYSNGYSYVRISERYEGYKDVIPTRPQPAGSGNLFEGDEFLINQGKLDALLQEVSFGFGYANKFSDHVGIGFTFLGAYRDQTKIRYETYSAFDTTNEQTASTDIYIDNDFWAVRIAGKFGISVVFEHYKFGAAITTPSIPIKFASGGTDGASLTSNNVYYTIDSTTNEVKVQSILASDRQEGLPVKYKTPLSISAGIEYDFTEDTKIHFAAEWFALQTAYVVMQPESDNFIMNPSASLKPKDSAVTLRVYDATRSVINLGLAVEQKLNSKFTGYAAVRTDFSNANFAEIAKIQGLYLGYTDWNIYHFTVGTSLIMENTFIGVGFEYSHGERSDFPQVFNFPSGSATPDDLVLYGYRGTCKAIYNNFNIFAGVTQLL